MRYPPPTRATLTAVLMALVATTLLLSGTAPQADATPSDRAVRPAPTAPDQDLGLVCTATTQPDLTVDIAVSTLDASAAIGVLRNDSVYVGTVHHMGTVVDDPPSAGEYHYRAIVHGTEVSANCGTVDVAQFGCTAQLDPGYTPTVTISPSEPVSEGPAVRVTFHSADDQPVPSSTLFRHPSSSFPQYLYTITPGTEQVIDDDPEIWFLADSEPGSTVSYIWDVADDRTVCGPVTTASHPCWATIHPFTDIVRVHINPAFANDDAMQSLSRVDAAGTVVDELDWVPGQLEYVDDTVASGETFMYRMAARLTPPTFPLTPTRELEVYRCKANTLFVLD